MTDPAPPPTVLIIDDERDTRESLRIILEAAGYGVRTARDGAEGLKLQEERPADVVITDIFMPVVEGLETIQEIRSRFPRTKIIAVSGGGTAVRSINYLESAGIAGADATLTKPFAPEDLLALLASCLAGGKQ